MPSSLLFTYCCYLCCPQQRAADSLTCSMKCCHRCILTHFLCRGTENVFRTCFPTMMFAFFFSDAHTHLQVNTGLKGGNKIKTGWRQINQCRLNGAVEEHTSKQNTSGQSKPKHGSHSHMTHSPNISLTPTHQNLIQAMSGLICVIQFVFPDMLSPLCSESW